MSNNIEIREMLYNKHNIEQKISTMIYGSIEVREKDNKKFIYVHYREDGKLINKYVGEYSDDLYNVILNNNILAKSLKLELKEINKKLKNENINETELTEEVKLNVDFAKRNLVDTIYNQAVLEGIATTYADTERIIVGGTISGMTTEDIMKVINLKHAWEFILSENVLLSPSNFNLITQINKLIEEGFYYNAGKLRTIPVKIGGTSWIPNLPIETKIKEDLEIIYNNDDIIDVAINLLLYVMKSQMFLDGNKRTAVIFANHYLISKGCGIIVIPNEDVEEYKKMLIDYYQDINIDKIKKFLREKCFQSI